VERRGLPWLEPIEVGEWLTSYVVHTHAGFVGGGLMDVTVDIHTGQVKRIRGPTPR
jgi:hypothetical protein